MDEHCMANTNEKLPEELQDAMLDRFGEITSEPGISLQERMNRLERKGARNSPSALQILLCKRWFQVLLLLEACGWLILHLDDPSIFYFQNLNRYRSDSFRFSALSLRDGTPAHQIASPHIQSFGLLNDGCYVSSSAAVTSRKNTMEILFDEEVEMNGWWFETLHDIGTEQRDPVKFVLERKLEDGTWALTGASGWHTELSIFLEFWTAQFETPRRRGVEEKFDYRVYWPYWAGWTMPGVALGLMHLVAVALAAMKRESAAMVLLLRGLLLNAALSLAAAVGGMVYGDAHWRVWLGEALSIAVIPFYDQIGLAPVGAAGVGGCGILLSRLLDALLPPSRSHSLTRHPPIPSILLISLFLLHRLTLAWRQRQALELTRQDRDRFGAWWQALAADAGAKESLALLQRATERVQAAAAGGGLVPRQLNLRAPGAEPQLQKRLDWADSGAWAAMEPACALPVSSLEQLRSQASVAHLLLRRHVARWAQASAGLLRARNSREPFDRITGSGGSVPCGELELVRCGQDGWEEVVEWAPSKGEERSAAKAVSCYNSDPSLLLDLARETIFFESVEDMTRCVGEIEADGQVCVVRARNQMEAGRPRAEAWSGGFRMVKLNLQLRSPAARRLAIHAHVAELLLVLTDAAALTTSASRLRYLRLRSTRPQPKIRLPCSLRLQVSSIAGLVTTSFVKPNLKPAPATPPSVTSFTDLEEILVDDSEMGPRLAASASASASGDVISSEPESERGPEVESESVIKLLPGRASRSPTGRPEPEPELERSGSASGCRGTAYSTGTGTAGPLALATGPGILPRSRSGFTSGSSPGRAESRSERQSVSRSGSEVTDPGPLADGRAAGRSERVGLQMRTKQHLASYAALEATFRRAALLPADFLNSRVSKVGDAVQDAGSDSLWFTSRPIAAAATRLRWQMVLLAFSLLFLAGAVTTALMMRKYEAGRHFSAVRFSVLEPATRRARGGGAVQDLSLTLTLHGCALNTSRLGGQVLRDSSGSNLTLLFPAPVAFNGWTFTSARPPARFLLEGWAHGAWQPVSASRHALTSGGILLLPELSASGWQRAEDSDGDAGGRAAATHIDLRLPLGWQLAYPVTLASASALMLLAFVSPRLEHRQTDHVNLVVSAAFLLAACFYVAGGLALLLTGGAQWWRDGWDLLAKAPVLLSSAAAAAWWQRRFITLKLPEGVYLLAWHLLSALFLHRSPHVLVRSPPYLAATFILLGAFAQLARWRTYRRSRLLIRQDLLRYQAVWDALLADERNFDLLEALNAACTALVPPHCEQHRQYNLLHDRHGEKELPLAAATPGMSALSLSSRSSAPRRSFTRSRSDPAILRLVGSLPPPVPPALPPVVLSARTPPFPPAAGRGRRARRRSLADAGLEDAPTRKAFVVSSLAVAPLPMEPDAVTRRVFKAGSLTWAPGSTGTESLRQFGVSTSSESESPDASGRSLLGLSALLLNPKWLTANAKPRHRDERNMSTTSTLYQGDSASGETTGSDDSTLGRAKRSGRWWIPRIRRKMRGMPGDVDRAAPVRSLDQLFAQACGTYPILLTKVQQWALASGGKFALQPPNDPEAPDRAPADLFVSWEKLVRRAARGGKGEEVRWAKLKSADRAVEKLFRSYQGDVSRLLDLCRQSIVFDDVHGMLRCLHAVAADPEAAVVRIKNRFVPGDKGAGQSGYRDVAFNVRIVSEESQRLGLQGHVCEVQLLLSSYATLKHAQGHARYVMYRNARGE